MSRPLRRPARVSRESASRTTGSGESGYLRIGTFGRAGIFAHWSMLLLLVYYAVTARPWAFVGHAIVIVVHELGHAVAALACREVVLYVELHAMGGVCWTTRSRTELGEIVIAWGGVLAQLLLFALAWGFVRAGFAAALPADLIERFLGWNLAIAALNLLPLRGLDGDTALRIVPYALRTVRRRFAADADARPGLRPVGPGPFKQQTSRGVRAVEYDPLIIDDEEARALAARLLADARKPRDAASD